LADPLGGKLAFYFLLALLLALPAAALVLAIYRRAIVRGMQAAAGATPSSARVTGSAHAPAPPPRAADARRQLLRTAAIYAAASAIPLIGIGLLDLGLGEDGVAPIQLLAHVAAGGTLLVPMLKLYFGWSLAGACLRFVAYLVVAASVMVALPFASHLAAGDLDFSLWSNAYWFVGFLLLTAWLPFLLMLLTGMPRLRAVVPMTLAAALVAVAGPALALEWAAHALSGGAGLDLLLELGLGTTVVLAVLLGLPVVYLALLLLGRGYRAKRFSDNQLLIDCWWLMLLYLQSAQLVAVHGHGWLPAAGLALFAAYRLSVAAGFRILSAPSSDRPGRGLLLLRVFGDDRRSEALFDHVVQRWRSFGSIQLIVATDLASRVIDPDDILALLSGRLRSRFIAGPRDIDRRLAELDTARDPDGRFRVNEFYCRDDTWQHTLGALLARRDLILMDLRGFCRERAGVRYELERLRDTGLLADTVLVLDATTERTLLEQTLPRGGASQAKQVQVGSDVHAAAERILAALLEQAASRQPAA
jgi:hypothetical protein